MRKEQIIDKEAICLLISFIIGSTLIVGVSGSSKNDAWLSSITGFVMAVPVLLIYSRILTLYPQKDLFDILTLVIGKIAGKFVTVVYTLYAFHLGSLVLRNFGEFMNSFAMPETPMIIPLVAMGMVCIIAARLGVEVLGRTTTYFLPGIFLILLIVQLLALPQLHINYLKPVLGNGITPVLKDGYSAFAFPFAETVVFMGVFDALKTPKSPKKVYFLGVVIAAAIITITTVRNIAVLGNMLGSFYFPSYEAVSRISIGNVIERIEITVSFVFVFGVFVKTSVCMMVAGKGIEKLLNLKSYRSIIIQIGVLMILFAQIIYDNIMQMRLWAFKVYPYYAFPMQVILPVIIWIIAEIKNRKIRKMYSNADQKAEDQQ
ncbi:GerAB/ArcD/ProY family transporter [Acetanaerobacterium elongatum]|uniref:Spore germination protein KB n=1 Tax=Acetanaerobacterium elongatum TaxID=258515 RepID=A0A1G9U035_9FIRM|nr:endospore germination permease [Acetanaerobacterium elongatum]SDM53252.1 spore germination protein KB [Acetanaerobacterium elongatum]